MVGIDDHSDAPFGQLFLTQMIVRGGHGDDGYKGMLLVETLAERIAAGVLADNRVKVVRVRIEKLDVFEEIEAVGVEIERRSTPA